VIYSRGQDPGREGNDNDDAIYLGWKKAQNSRRYGASPLCWYLYPFSMPARQSWSTVMSHAVVGTCETALRTPYAGYGTGKLYNFVIALFPAVA
jgi:hypothetical protein